mmetsp:Transcript_54526/g.100909  ORF Transcript_54526/g.100909 Transcript_54526/m.100909 type:complete len:439 (-) Transcript_54526:13-1329(-)
MVASRLLSWFVLTSLQVVLSIDQEAQLQQAQHSCHGQVALCIKELAALGFDQLGKIDLLTRTCGDENPPLDLLLHPEWLPAGQTRRLLEAGLPQAAEAARQLSLDAFALLQHQARGILGIVIDFAHGCLQRDACKGKAAVFREVWHLHASFLESAGALLQRADAAPASTSWLPALGDPGHIILRRMLAQKHIDFWGSALSGVNQLEDSALVMVLQDLAVRLASAACELQSELVGHFTVAHILPTLEVVRLQLDFPRLEFQSGWCCRRYHVLGNLIASRTDHSEKSAFHMVEVGVNNAITSDWVLSNNPMLTFDGVDPWIDAEDIREEAHARLKRFGTRVRLWQATSVEAANHFPEKSLDLVFIDGDHSQQAVLVDLRTWAPRVKSGGLLAGHDLFNPAYEGVLEALLMFMNTLGAPAVEPAGKMTLNFGPDFVWWLEL